jgi:16S rRNA (uracil1498-N3)-methyltransferase
VQRFYLPPDECAGSTLTLKGREAHHALNVLRLQRRERVVVLNGRGEECLCEVRDCERDQLQLEVLQRRTFPALPHRLTLLQALPKGKLIEDIIEKATELGAFRIVPLLSERVVVRLDPAQGHGKAAKWQDVAIEAIKQCGSPWLPKVEAPVTPRTFLSRGEPFELSLVASLQAGSRHPGKCFEDFRQTHGRQPASIGVWVGPEGDFTLEELEAIKSGGALPITLGPLILRTETAAVYCLSVINYELQGK